MPHGSAEQIAEVVRAHLDAGADHVCVQPLGEAGIPRESWTALARVLVVGTRSGRREIALAAPLRSVSGDGGVRVVVALIGDVEAPADRAGRGAWLRGAHAP